MYFATSERIVNLYGVAAADSFDVKGAFCCAFSMDFAASERFVNLNGVAAADSCDLEGALSGDNEDAPLGTAAFSLGEALAGRGSATGGTEWAASFFFLLRRVAFLL